MRDPLLLYLAVVFCSILSRHPTFADTTLVRVTSITPRYGSTGGATKITIYGRGFASNQFNNGSGNEHLGNTVDLVSITKSYECEILKDQTSTKQIVCVIPPRMTPDDYFVKVKVDGEAVPNDNHCYKWKHTSCRLQITSSYNVLIYSIEPASGPPNSTIIVKGRTRANQAGVSFMRSYVGGYECKLLHDPDDPEMLLLNYQGFTCSIQSQYVGNQNVSYIVSGYYGRSVPNLGALRVSGSNTIYSFQSYAEITSVTPQTVSTAGGAVVTIAGRNFDETKTPAQVNIGGENCDVISVTLGEIRCTIPAQPVQDTVFSGNRGLDMERWSNPGVSGEQVLELPKSSDITHTEDFVFTVPARKTSRIRTIFVPPSNNTYRFEITKYFSDVSFKLFFTEDAGQRMEIASSAKLLSFKYTLQQGSRYFLDFVAESRSTRIIQVGVCVSDTKLTSGMTGGTKSEVQRIVVKSTLKKEKQTFDLSGLARLSGTAEIQTVDVLASTSALEGSTYRLGISNVYTVPLLGNADSTTVSNALLAIPGTVANSVTVIQSDTTGGTRYTVTFSPNLGDVDLMTVKSEPNERGETLTVTVKEAVKGVPTLETFRLVLNDIISAPIPLNPTTSQVETSVMQLFVEKCPSAIGKPVGSAYFEDFENIAQSLQKDETENGTIVRAFCGRSYRKIPTNHYFYSGAEINVEQYKTVCFAYIGSIRPTNNLLITYKYIHRFEREMYTSRWFFVEELIPSERWRYVCFDIFALLTKVNPEGTKFRVTGMRLSTVGDGYLYIDNLYIGRQQTTTDFKGLNEGWTKRRQALPSGHMIDGVVVTQSGSKFSLELTPNECGNNFDIFGIHGGQITSGSNSRPSQSVVYSYGGRTVNINVDEKATPPVTGTYDLTFKGKTKTVSVKSTAQELQDILHSIGATGTVVKKTGDCANYEWEITWTGKGGDQPQLRISNRVLSGTNVALTVDTRQDGMLCYNPIPAEFLRTVHSVPQVSAYINGIPTACNGSCDLQWSASSTPTVTAVTPSTGSLGSTLTISGTKFSTTPSENTVVIGGTNCTVQSATENSITCDVGNGPRGSFQVMVTVSSQGLASHPNPVITFTYVADVISISPTTGSTEGGTLLSILGYGFSNNPNVSVGGISCALISNSPSRITCVTPRSFTRADTTVNVEVTQNGLSLTTKTFTYRVSLSASISSVSPTTSSVQGGVEITITGTGFGRSKPSDDALMIGNVPAAISYYSDTQVTGVLPGQAPGSYPVRLKTSVSGYADTREHSISHISYVLEVTNLFPRTGSLHGGTRLTITGRGFSTVIGDNEVRIGSHSCAVESSTEAQIVCKIEDITKVHTITNQGQSPVHGTGYAWDKPFVTVEVGDTVRWEWTSDETLGLRYKVQRTTSLTSKRYDRTGFNSGSTGMSSGHYEYQFTETGLNSYWSGYVSQDPLISLKGEIEVVARPSRVGYLNVTVGKYEAIYDTLSGMSDPNSASCSGVTSVIPGCSVPQPPTSDSSKFSLFFWECSTPLVNQILPVQGTADRDIVITGSGFTSTNCENEVYIGKYRCLIINTNADQITAKVDPAEEVPVGTILPVTVRIGNRGNALIKPLKDGDRRFVFLPFVSGISPTTGSKAGGTELTISGGGFSKNSTVNLGLYECVVSLATYSAITCTTVASTGSVRLLIRSPISNGQIVNAVCAATNGCSFTYTSQQTPSLSSVTPTEVDTPNARITLTGSGFGTDTTKIRVSLGSGGCVPDTVSNTQIICIMQNVPAGSHPVHLSVAGKGLAESGSVTLLNRAKLNSLTPSSGSIHGGTRITISGNGFIDGVSMVMVDSNPCVTESVAAGDIVCVTPAHAAASSRFVVKSGNVIFSPSQIFTYSVAKTPAIASTSPTEATAGSTLTITGTGLTGNITITIDGVVCTVTSTSPLQCTLGSHSAGEYPVLLHVKGVGYANKDKIFKYSIGITSISPETGSFAGGQLVSVSGSGFDPLNSVVTICDQKCHLAERETQTSSTLKCITPIFIDGFTSSKTCDVTVAVNNVVYTLRNGFTYMLNLTPIINNVSPVRGGTAGGTSVTITGQRFSSVESENSVTIGGVSCIVTSASITQIVCTTGASDMTQETNVSMIVRNKGLANQTSAGFHYVDVWSSQWTWGGQSPPEAGDVVVIQKGQSVLLDKNTPVLKTILIQGGKLIFDEIDVELQAEIILITDGGILQVGTEAEPFQHKAIITLHGHVRSKELPIYGTKNIAVREGILDLHGKPVHLIWTRLSTTAFSGTNSLELMQAVDWSVGDKIVIATTGDRHSQRENEEQLIAGISTDLKTLTLQSALKYTHLGVTETFDGQELEFRSEVGLLTRNVVVRGSDDTTWHDVIPACEDGFDTGEFATQTCFQGRYGQEIGSDEFGAQIILHAQRPSENLVVGRLEYIEMTYVGQAFRLGRYPVHFHLNGDMSGSYVRGLGIHRTFNRAVSIHGTHNVLVEHTVVYDIMGGAFFLEDGIETGNIFQYNLAVFVKSSSSLLNDDITPAAFFISNPNNTIRHNAAAGGSHIGFWYRLNSNPQGASYTTNICPNRENFGVFKNNSVHSQGWFGISINTYYPQKRRCYSSNPIKAVFENFTVWNCEKGAEFGYAGSVQFDKAILVNNEVAGMEGKMIQNSEEFSENGPLIKNSLIVAHTATLATSMGPTSGGVVLPYQQGYSVYNVTFVNFDQKNTAALRFTRTLGTCSNLCGGFTYHIGGIRKVSSPNLGIFDWTHEGVITDTDGSTSGVIGGHILPTVNTLPSTKCSHLAGFSVNIEASVCQPDVNFVRLVLYPRKPLSLRYKHLIVTNSYGNDSISFSAQHIPTGFSWMTTLVSGEQYDFQFVGGETLENITYSLYFSFQKVNHFVVLTQRLQYLPDRFSFGNNYINESDSRTLSPLTHSQGGWIFDRNSNHLRYIVTGDLSNDPMPATITKNLYLQAFRCYYVNCAPPAEPNTTPPARRRPNNAMYWSNRESWKDVPEGWGGNYGNGSYGLPRDGDDVIIMKGTWIVADVVLPRIKKLFIYGVLELDGEYNNTIGGYRDFELSAEYIYIVGGRLIVGWPDSPFKGQAEIILRGSRASPLLDDFRGVKVGAKAMGVFGGLDIHGKEVRIPWTTLATSADVNATTLTLATSVDWSIGDEIVLTATGYDPWETETFKVVSVSGTQVVLNATVQYRHLAFAETVGSQTYTLTAEVGLLTRNVKIIGEDYNNLYSESFGARVIVGLAADTNNSYLGYARITNVEFYHTGQDGFTQPNDPRHSVAFLDCGTISANRPSYVNNNAFHNGFSTAIGVYNTHGIEITNNVIHHTVGPGIEVRGDNVSLVGNLVVLSIFPGTYRNRRERLNAKYVGAIDVRKSADLRLTGNAVSGSERVAYRVPGESCNSPTQWTGNVARSSLIGVGFFPGDDGIEKCVKISNFSVFMCPDFGVYVNTNSSVVLTDLTLVGNMLGVFPMVIGPSAVAHKTADKSVSLTNTLIVGTGSSFDCITNVLSSDPYVVDYTHARSNVLGNRGKVGIVWPTFTQSSNEAPVRSFMGITSYPAINGVMYCTNVTFADFSDRCGRKDVAIATNPQNDDGQHPIESRLLKFINTPHKNKVFIHRPNIQKVNPSDCVDMDCDAKKKSIILDKDGTLVGSTGAVIPQSEFEWDENTSRGLGNYRIPKVLLTGLDGSRINATDIAPNKGIYRTTSCDYVPDWQAYSCPNQNYRMLIIESLDSDTETRRLSPVSVLVDDYIDLINGPQEHSFCAGHSCNLRLSTFMAVLPTGKEASVYFTSTTPQSLRFHLLNSAASEGVLLSVWYSQPYRLDVYYYGDLKLPTNGYYDAQGHLQFNKVNLAVGKPKLSSQGTATNYVDHGLNLLFIIVKGHVPVEIKTTPMVAIVFETSLEFLTIDQFYGENLVKNIVAFLGVDPSKVRFVQVVREGSVPLERRRREASDKVHLYIEIGDEPAPSLNATVSDAMTMSELNNHAVALVNGVLLGRVNFSAAMSVIEPLPSPSDPAWIYRTVSNETSAPELVMIEQIDRLEFETESEAVYEGMPFSVSPKLVLLSLSGSRVRKLGTTVFPWKISVTMEATGESKKSATLTGNTTLMFRDGWVTFDGLTISHAGTYILKFAITSPPEAVHFMLRQTIVVPGRPQVVPPSNNINARLHPGIIAGIIAGSAMLLTLVVVLLAKAISDRRKKLVDGTNGFTKNLGRNGEDKIRSRQNIYQT